MKGIAIQPKTPAPNRGDTRALLQAEARRRRELVQAGLNTLDLIPLRP